MAALVIMRPQGLTSAADQTENPRTNNTKRPAVRQAEIEAECDVRQIIVIGTHYGPILLSIRKSAVERKSRLARIGGCPLPRHIRALCCFVVLAFAALSG